jgi:hypothetical protein
MAKTVAIVGPSGEGKSTGIRTLDPKTTFIINADGKSLPFRNADSMYNVNTKNYVNNSNQTYIKQCVQGLNKLPHIKTIVIDTANAIMLDVEMSANFRSRKAGGEAMNKWMDLAAEIYDLICECNDLREDLVIFICFHATLYTDIYGNERKCIVTNGRKLEKIHLESKFPLVLYTHVKYGGNGKNEYFLETQANSSTGKTPMEMFEEFLIPNDFKLIDNKIREYYGIK